MDNFALIKQRFPAAALPVDIGLVLAINTVGAALRYKCL
jgi:hypothetical protein